MQPAGVERNARYLQPDVDWGDATEHDRNLLVDPQTSGGLLVAVPSDRLDDYLSRVPGATLIGEAVARESSAIVVVA